MYVKKKSIEGYFSNTLAISAWRKAKVIFDESNKSIISGPDGRYEAILVDAGFESAKARPFSAMVFELPNGVVVKKAIAIDGADGIARLLFDLAKFNIMPKTPVALETAYEEIKDKQFQCVIDVRSTDGVRYVHIESVKGATRETAPAAVVSQPELPFIAPIVPPAPKQPPVEEKTEANVKPGDRIMVRDGDKENEAIILTEYPDDYELAVRFFDGRKAIISANDIISLVESAKIA